MTDALGKWLTREQAEALGYTVEHCRDDGRVRSMTTKEGYLVVYGAPSYQLAVSRATPPQNPTNKGPSEGDMK